MRQSIRNKLIVSYLFKFYHLTVFLALVVHSVRYLPIRFNTLTCLPEIEMEMILFLKSNQYL